MKLKRIGVDLAKQVFQVHGVDSHEQVKCRKQLKRHQMLDFFRQLEPCVVAMEACGSAHYWGRELRALGHDVRLILPSYVKAYVKRGKTDAADAEAIAEAVSRPTMRFIPIKSEEEQAALIRHKVRTLLIKQQTMLINEKKLSMMNPEHRKLLEQEMVQFLFEGKDVHIEGYTPPEKQ